MSTRLTVMTQKPEPEGPATAETLGTRAPRLAPALQQRSAAAAAAAAPSPRPTCTRRTWRLLPKPFVVPPL